MYVPISVLKGLSPILIVPNPCFQVFLEVFLSRSLFERTDILRAQFRAGFRNCCCWLTSRLFSNSWCVLPRILDESIKHLSSLLPRQILKSITFAESHGDKKELISECLFCLVSLGLVLFILGPENMSKSSL